MSAPFFTTNDSDIPKLEGLYVKERNPPAVISGANVGTTYVVGETIRGPVDKAVLISSEARFKEVFGGARQVGVSTGSAITNMVWKALMNKPFGTLYVVRACAAAAVTAFKNLADVTPTNIIKVAASGPGIWGNNITVAVENATDADATHFNLRVNYDGKDYLYKNLNTQTGNDNTLAVIGTDDGNPVVVTKLADGRPLNAVAAALSTGTPGTQGSIADSDFTASNRGINVAATYPGGGGVVFIAERSSSTLKSAIITLAASATDRMYLMCPDSETVSASTAITEVGGLTRTDRVIYCFNNPYTLDNEAGAEVVTHPTSWMASVLSQTDVDIHPGEEDTKQFMAGITRLYTESFQRADYIAFKDAGIAAIEKDNGFAFVSGVTISLTPGKEQITRRRMTDYLQLSVANALKFSVKKKNTETRRRTNGGMIQNFLGDLKLAQRIVEDFKVDTDILNTPTQRAAGIEKILMRVRLIGHMLELVLETEIGTAVVITQTS